jgi:hypothetical protein
MLINQPIRLNVSDTKDFIPVYCLLNCLLIGAALFSPHPVLLTSLVVLLSGAAWLVITLIFSKPNSVKLISVIFADGRLRLESNWGETFEGFLDGQQWCNHRLAVLRTSNGKTTRRLIICSWQQQGADDFRRLNMWLRQGLCDDTRTRPVLVLPR